MKKGIGFIIILFTLFITGIYAAEKRAESVLFSDSYFHGGTVMVII